MAALRPRWIWSLIAATPVLALASGPAAADPPAGAPPAAAAIPSESEVVSLVTGDRVVIDRFDDGRQAITVRPGPTRDHVGHHTINDGDQVYVIPFDAAGLVPDVLDRELFNVTKLAAHGYHDGVPVVATGRPAVQTSAYTQASAVTRASAVTQAGAAGPAGMAVHATLPSIDAVAATIDSTGAWWRETAAGGDGHDALAPTGALAAATGGPAAADEKVWLDGRVEATLAESVPLIGSPAAWDAGYDGAGVTVAVLDTGIDAAHPDLAGRVAAEANFTDSDTADDLQGHGTHVAGILAGSGAASGGDYTGTAPGATLLNGKVLREDGSGTVSGVIAGMEWAVAQGADVVNMSLGAPATDGTDPMSQAVNQLTAEHDVLFVTSAGNDGSGDYTVGTPAAADAVLSVGSVTKSEFLSFSSSRGPRLGDHAVKPDITAPGVLITSARADGTSSGTPVDEHYSQRSGTSMASPHVAGAAAILQQADPGLDPAKLKAMLSTTAVPHDNYDVYQQGGGRADVAAALDAPVLATPSPVSLGYFPYPQEDVEPASAEVSYANRTDATVTLDLAFDVASRDGETPSDEMLSVQPDEITLAPGATTEVTVTADVTEGAHGLYGGYLVADSDGQVVTRTPLGFYHEPEHYDVTIEGVARDGGPAGAPSTVDVLEVTDGSVRDTNVDFVDGVATVRVPPGTYAANGVVFSGPEGATRDWTLVNNPEFEVSGPTTIVLDARDGQRVAVDTPEHDTAPVDEWTLDYRRFSETGGWLGHRYTMPVSAFPDGMYAVETGDFTLGDMDFTSRSRHGTADPAPEHLYDLVYHEPGGVPADLHYVAEVDALASVTNRFHSDTTGQTGGEIRHVWTPGLGISSAPVVDLPLPSARTEYLVPGLRYQQSIYQEGHELGRIFEPITEYTAGEVREQTWWKGPRRPGLREGGPHDISVPAVRRGDTMRFPLMEWVDSHPGHYAPGDASDSATFRLYQDGELVTDVRPPSTGLEVGPEPSTFALEFDVSRDADWWTTSTQTQTTWTFQSEQGPPDTNVALPLVLVDYEMDLDLENTAPLPQERRGPPTIDLVARHQAGADGPPIAGTRLWLSYDDGQTWRSRPGSDLGDGHYRYLLDRRAIGDTTGFASLRVEAWDVDGNRLEQEIIRAWALPPRG